MNHYEELGIHRDATPGEIREAYRLAARLLHPDLQRDQRLKELAECQMRRLSDVVAMLVDPRERARYDAGLARAARDRRLAAFSRATAPELLQTVVRHWYWILLGSMTAAMGGWYVMTGNAYVPAESPVAQSAGAPAGPDLTRNERAPKKKQRDETADTRGADGPVKPLPPREMRPRVSEEPRPIAKASSPTPVEIPADAPKVEQTAMPAASGVATARVAGTTDESGFSGEWLNAAEGREEARAGTYPAKYVEFRLRRENGALVGDYRALHVIVDKAISPEVVFRVHGVAPQKNTGTLDWESSSGARGELELTLQAADRLQVKWWTTQFGRQEALSSGVAVLMRLRTP